MNENRNFNEDFEIEQAGPEDLRERSDRSVWTDPG